MVRLIRKKEGYYNLYRNGNLLVSNLNALDAFTMQAKLIEAEEKLNDFIDDLIENFCQDLCDEYFMEEE